MTDLSRRAILLALPAFAPARTARADAPDAATRVADAAAFVARTLAGA
ncbi:hypothetical protein NX784_00555 [Massilia pinisoli]|uniref:Uncharacterized protein n=1 Tax=Massilia pinisoli TaxID=1772194 RepID=A0ABT1ZJI6_9BURK|nr:hypothetical protein [Massilia pinisoli]MCS0580073.1 hypothetical protein [Massilia pinisoli]